MPRLSARDVTHIACNPHCHLQAALPLLDLQEREAFQLLTGKRYAGPRGERTAAYAWGRLFESSLIANQSQRLLEALQGVLPISPATPWIRDLRQEVPDLEDDAVASRAARTRRILHDLLAGNPVPDLVLQPALVLRRDGVSWGHIAPDGLVLDRTRKTYLPLETKAFISLDGIITPQERLVLRLQAAVEILALESELTGLDAAVTILPQALLIVATPFGFRPQPAVLEALPAELAAVDAGLKTLARVLAHPAVHQPAPLRERLMRLPYHYQERCLLTCALAGFCRTRAPQVRASLGDRVAQLVGEDIDLARVITLLGGDPPATQAEEALQRALDETVTIYGWR